MANSQTFVFMGRSGSGKGTQAKLLMERLAKESPEHAIYYLETGQRFRDFLNEPYHASALAKKIMDSGERQPDFLAIYMWSHLLVENMKGDEHLVMDGTPRSLLEAQALGTALNFFNRSDARIIHINISREVAETRLRARGRSDDAEAGIQKRLDWFDRDVVPAIEYYRSHPEYHFHEINGEQSVEAVQAELLQAVYGQH